MKIGSKLFFVVKCCITFGAMWWIVLQLDFEHFLPIFSSVSLLPVIGAIASFFLMQILNGIRWWLLAKPLGLKLTLQRSTLFYFTGIFFNNFLPGGVGGDIIRIWLCNRDQGGQQIEASIISVVMDRINGIYGIFIVATIAAWIFQEFVPLEWVFGITAISIGGFLTWPVVPYIWKWLQNVLGRFARFLPNSILVYWKPGSYWWPVLILSAGYQVGLAVTGIFVSVALDLDVPFLYYFFIFPTTAFIASMPISLGGHGVREGMVVIFLGWVGVDTASSAALGIIYFLCSLVSYMFGGLLFLLTKDVSSKNLAEMKLPASNQ